MKQDSIITKLDLNFEDRQKIGAVVTRIEDSSPSDASVFFKLEKVEDKYVGSLKVISQLVDINLAEENYDITNLLDILNNECKHQISDWKKNRKF